MSDLHFYTNPQSRGQIVRWMLAELGVDYETTVVEYGPAMKGDDYLAINPMGKVPAIVHNGKSVTEAAAICAYLADVFPEAQLGPTDDERADYYRWLFFAAGPVEQAITDHAVFKLQPEGDQQSMVGYGTYDRVVETLADWLSERDYICGDRFTAADVYVGACIDFGLMFGTLPERAAFSAYVGRLRQREAYQRAKAMDVPSA